MKNRLLLIVGVVSFVACGSNNGAGTVRTIEPLALSGQIRDYKGGEKYIQGIGIQDQSFIGTINNAGRFSITIPENSVLGSNLLFSNISRCQNASSPNTQNPVSFNVFPIYLKVYPSKTSPLPADEGTLFQSTCGENSCVLPNNNFRLRTVYIDKAVSVKNYTCTIPKLDVRDIERTYNFNLDLKVGWNTIQFVEQSITADSQTLNVENYNLFSPEWNLTPPGQLFFMAQPQR